MSEGKGRIFQRFQAKVAQIARRTGMALPASFYRYAPCRCWKCREEILVFAWPGQVLFSKMPPDKHPMPRTIRLTFSKTVGDSYWANTCPHCQAIQGDFFQHCEPDGPFFGFSCGEDTLQAFEQDLQELASRAAYLSHLS